MKPLDFVKTPKGNMALIKEINQGEFRINKGDNMAEVKTLKVAHIEFLGGGNHDEERNAWWYEDELEVIDNLASLLARNLVHPFGTGRSQALSEYPMK